MNVDIEYEKKKNMREKCPTELTHTFYSAELTGIAEVRLIFPQKLRLNICRSGNKLFL